MTAALAPSAPSALRNREPIAAVLERVLAPGARVLEVASGDGTHAAYFADRLPGRHFQPSEADARALAAIDRRVGDRPGQVEPAIRLDVLDAWPALEVDAVLCINMLHIAPPEALPALMAGAAGVLRPGGVLLTYGAYRIAGAHTAPSNVEFDAWLKQRDPRFGVRDLEQVVAVAAAEGLAFEQQVEMPANNLMLVFRRG